MKAIVIDCGRVGSAIAVELDRNTESATPAYRLASGDQMLAIVKPGRTDELRKALALT